MPRGKILKSINLNSKPCNTLLRHLDIKLTILQISFQVEEPLEQITKSTLLRKDDGEETAENSTDYMEMMEGIMDR